jgi:hypothetical protein
MTAFVPDLSVLTGCFEIELLSSAVLKEVFTSVAVRSLFEVGFNILELDLVGTAFVFAEDLIEPLASANTGVVRSRYFRDVELFVLMG